MFGDDFEEYIEDEMSEEDIQESIDVNEGYELGREDAIRGFPMRFTISNNNFDIAYRTGYEMTMEDLC